MRISSPPVAWPCFYGIDFATKAELIAGGLGVEEIRASIGADSLAYVSLDGLVGSSGQDQSRLCTACFSGEYPIPLSDVDPIGKHVLEGIERGVLESDEPVPHALLGGVGAADALSRP